MKYLFNLFHNSWVAAIINLILKREKWNLEGVTCPKSHTWQVPGPTFKPQLDYRAWVLSYWLCPGRAGHSSEMERNGHRPSKKSIISFLSLTKIVFKNRTELVEAVCHRHSLYFKVSWLMVELTQGKEYYFSHIK